LFLLDGYKRLILIVSYVQIANIAYFEWT